jgi:oxygen-independent coproporphyrinogen-3 oxidase
VEDKSPKVEDKTVKSALTILKKTSQSEINMLEVKMAPKAVYIHIPFCTQICNYCDFNKVYAKGQNIDKYLEALEKEITLYVSESVEVETIYIGGGTPTALDEKQLVKLFSIIHRYFNVNSSTEFTIEANPGDIDTEKIKILKHNGINRISLGVQSFNDQLLKIIGREHTGLQATKSIELINSSNIENINLDLIYALPTQDLLDWKKTLTHAINLPIKHISAYSLIIEPKTIFYIKAEKGEIELPSNDIEAEMYEFAMNNLAESSFNQYEISNFSKYGYESKHNLKYWNNEEYYGFGAGAHSYINSTRVRNIGTTSHYLKALEKNIKPILEMNTLSQQEKIEEELFLGLRKIKGININNFRKRYSLDLLNYYNNEINDLILSGLLELDGDQLKLTKNGLYFGNDVFMKFIKD